MAQRWRNRWRALGRSRFISGTLGKLHRAYFVDHTEFVPLSRKT